MVTTTDSKPMRMDSRRAQAQKTLFSVMVPMEKTIFSLVFVFPSSEIRHRQQHTTFSGDLRVHSARAAAHRAHATDKRTACARIDRVGGRYPSALVLTGFVRSPRTPGNNDDCVAVVNIVGKVPRVPITDPIRFGPEYAARTCEIPTRCPERLPGESRAAHTTAAGTYLLGVKVGQLPPYRVTSTIQ